MPMRPNRDEPTSLVDAIDRLLDKGLVINADICVSVAGVELLGVKIRAASLLLRPRLNMDWSSPAGPTSRAQAGRRPNMPRKNALSVVRKPL